MKPKRQSTLALLACLASLLGPVGELAAHEVRPALLDITETRPGWFEVSWKVPIFEGQRLVLTPVLPESLEPVGPVASRVVPGAFVESASFRAEEGALIWPRPGEVSPKNSRRLWLQSLI